MNIFERAITAVSPAWAAHRAAWRRALDELRAYDSAQTGRRGSGWRTNGGSANAELGRAASIIRDRARDLARNNPYAAKTVSTLTAAIWGTGIVPHLNTDAAKDPARVAARDIWNGFADNSDPEGQLDFYGQIALGIRALNESGEFLIRRIPRPPSWNLPVPLQIEILEGDYLDSSKTIPLDNGGVIIQGVEYDGFGRRVAYWLFDQHPGDSFAVFTKRGNFMSRRHDAADIRHVMNPLRPGQARGVSIFAPVALKFRDIGDLEDAELMRRKIASCFAAFVSPAAGIAASPLAGTGRTDAKEDGSRNEKLGPGLIKYLKPGEEVTFGSPPNAEGFADVLRVELRAAAAGCGVTYEAMTGDLSGVNFSSIRIGRNDFFDLVDQRQWHCVVPQVCNPIWQWVGQVAALKKRRSADDSWQAVWTPPARRLMSPKDDIEALRETVRSGFMPLSDAIASVSGEDPQDVLARYARDNADLDALKIIIDSDPRKVGKTSASTPAASANSTADAGDA